MGFFDLFKTPANPNQLKLKEYYQKNNYNVIPVLPPEEECAELFERSKLFGDSLFVHKSYMNYIDSDSKLLRGHIIMLWWIYEVSRKKVPLYFLFEYGIDFDDELHYLHNLELLDSNNHLTAKGQKTLEEYRHIVRQHKAMKTQKGNDEIEYVYTDAEVVKDIEEFQSTGDFVKDQHLGKSFEQNNDYDNAIKAYKNAIELAKITDDGTIPPNPYRRLAIIYRKLKDKESEIAILKEGIKNTNYISAKTGYNWLEERLEKILNK